MEHKTNQDRPANLTALKIFLEKAAAKYLIEAGSEERFLEKAGEIDPFLSQEGKEVFLGFAKNGLLAQQAQKNTAQ